jgi:hypothetical protein
MHHDTNSPKTADEARAALAALLGEQARRVKPSPGAPAQERIEYFRAKREAAAEIRALAARFGIDPDEFNRSI